MVWSLENIGNRRSEHFFRDVDIRYGILFESGFKQTIYNQSFGSLVNENVTLENVDDDLNVDAEETGRSEYCYKDNVLQISLNVAPFNPGKLQLEFRGQYAIISYNHKEVDGSNLEHIISRKLCRKYLIPSRSQIKECFIRKDKECIHLKMTLNNFAAKKIQSSDESSRPITYWKPSRTYEMLTKEHLPSKPTKVKSVRKDKNIKRIVEIEKNTTIFDDLKSLKRECEIARKSIGYPFWFHPNCSLFKSDSQSYSPEEIQERSALFLYENLLCENLEQVEKSYKNYIEYFKIGESKSLSEDLANGKSILKAIETDYNISLEKEKTKELQVEQINSAQQSEGIPIIVVDSNTVVDTDAVDLENILPKPPKEKLKMGSSPKRSPKPKTSKKPLTEDLPDSSDEENKEIDSERDNKLKPLGEMSNVLERSPKHKDFSPVSSHTRGASATK